MCAVSSRRAAGAAPENEQSGQARLSKPRPCLPAGRGSRLLTCLPGACFKSAASVCAAAGATVGISALMPLTLLGFAAGRMKAPTELGLISVLGLRAAFAAQCAGKRHSALTWRAAGSSCACTRAHRGAGLQTEKPAVQPAAHSPAGAAACAWVGAPLAALKRGGDAAVFGSCGSQGAFWVWLRKHEHCKRARRSGGAPPSVCHPPASWPSGPARPAG